ncbi:MAG: hypothetical protein SCJ97_03325 [Bacillota bacterium]|nr:hypothetical protein [Bacillota bacterium]
MRKIFLGLIITGIATVIFISVRSNTSSIVINPPSPGTVISEEQVVMEPVGFFTITQGGSTKALVIQNNLSRPVRFSIGYEHPYLSFQPQSESIPSGGTIDVYINLDHLCPPGDIELPVYLRGDLEDERLGMEAVLSFRVKPGYLFLNLVEGNPEILWNGEPAPRGTELYYRIPGEEAWNLWGELPRISQSVDLDHGTYDFEFKAVLGEVESTPDLYRVTVSDTISFTEIEIDDLQTPEEVALTTPAPVKTPKPIAEVKPTPLPFQATPAIPGYTAYELKLSADQKSGFYYFRNFYVNPTENSLYLPDDAYVYISFDRDGLGLYFDWSSNYSFAMVVVRGGPAFNTYRYNPPTVGDYYLHPPVNPENKLYLGITSIIFYYGG